MQTIEIWKGTVCNTSYLLKVCKACSKPMPDKDPFARFFDSWKYDRKRYYKYRYYIFSLVEISKLNWNDQKTNRYLWSGEYGMMSNE